jgi:hypothetical protein
MLFLGRNVFSDEIPNQEAIEKSVDSSVRAGFGASLQPSYKEIFNSLLLVPNPTAPEIENEEDDSFTLLNSQIDKALGFLYERGKSARSYLAENEDEGKSGLSYVISDMLGFLKNSKAESDSEQEILDEFVRTLKLIPNSSLVLQNGKSHFEEATTESLEVPVIAPYELVIDETDDFRKAIENLILSVPKCITNTQIKIVAREYMSLIRNELDFLEGKSKTEVIPIVSDYIKKTENLLLVSENITSDDLKLLMYSIHNKLNFELNSYFTKDNMEALKVKLQDISNSLWDFQSTLNVRLPLNTPLRKNFDALVDLLRTKISETDQFSQLSVDQLSLLKTYLSKQLDNEFSRVDFEKYASNLNLVTPYFREGIFNKLKDSLSEYDIQFTIHGLISAAKIDLDNLTDESKESEFVWDVQDIDRISNNIVTQIKLLHDKNGRIQFKFSMNDLNNILEKSKGLIETFYKPDDGKNSEEAAQIFRAMINQAKLLEPFENEVYDLLSSDTFFQSVKAYVVSYLELVKSVAKKLKFHDWATKTEFFNTILQDLHLDKNIAERFLSAQITSESYHIRCLNDSDRRALSFLRNLQIKWTKEFQQSQNKFARLLKQTNSHLRSQQKDYRTKTSDNDHIDNLFLEIRGSNETSLNPEFTDFSFDMMDEIKDQYAESSQEAFKGIDKISKRMLEYWTPFENRTDVDFNPAQNFEALSRMIAAFSENEEEGERLESQLRELLLN